MGGDFIPQPPPKFGGYGLTGGVEAWLKKHSRECMSIRTQVAALDAKTIPELSTKCDEVLECIDKLASQHASRTLAEIQQILSDKVKDATSWRIGLERTASWTVAKQKLATVIASSGLAEKLATAMKKGKAKWKDLLVLKDKFVLELPKEEADACKTTLGAGALALSECTLTSIMVDEGLSQEAKRSRMQKCFDKITIQSRAYSSDIKKEFLPSIVANTVGNCSASCECMSRWPVCGAPFSPSYNLLKHCYTKETYASRWLCRHPLVLC